MRLAVLCLVASVVLPSISRAQAPVFAIPPEDSSIKFFGTPRSRSRLLMSQRAFWISRFRQTA